MKEFVESGEKVMDWFLVNFPVLSVLLLATLVSSIVVKSWFLLVLLIGFMFWVNQVWWEREKARIQFEERRKLNSKKAMTEGETLRWMNEGLKVMWPISMEKFASQHFFKPMAPWFLNKFKPKFVREVTLLSLHLGSTPPDFSLIRALPPPQDGDDDVIFEANMEFLSGKDMNAQMTVQMKGNLKTTFYISKLHIKGTVKFSVKFVKGWPVIGRIRFCFANTPLVDMTARPNFKHGLDMRFFPGAANWLAETLGTALEQSVVEPFMLVIDFEKLVSNMMFPDLRPRQALQEFFYLEHKSGSPPTVLVEILEAGDLKPANGGGFPDPIVEVTLGAHKERTNSRIRTLNPKWANERQRIPIVNWELPNLLTLRVICKKSYRQRELGICSIPVKECWNGERHEKVLKLENVPMGWIRVAITVEHHNRDSSHGAEESHANTASQPTTLDIQSITPPNSAPTTKASEIHTRNNFAEDARLVPAPHEAHEEVGTSENITMPYGTDGAFSIQCPGKGESLYFDPPITSSRKPKSSALDKGTLESKVHDAKVKGSMMTILGFKKKRSLSKVSHEISPPEKEREMTLSENSGYSSSLDRSMDLKVYHGALKMNLEMSPEMPSSREPPCLDIYPIEPLTLETILSSNPESIKTSEMDGHSHHSSFDMNLGLTTETNTKSQPHRDVNGASFPSQQDELNFGSQRHLLPGKQNSKNSWNWHRPKWSKQRKSRDRKPGESKRVWEHAHDGYESPSDTSTSQSFRKDPFNAIKTLFVNHPDHHTTQDTSTDNSSSILTSARSQSCRQVSTNSKKLDCNGGLSLRFDPSLLLNTIHEKKRLSMTTI